MQGILAGLGPQDRVQLIAVDLNAVPLTKTFVAPGGKEMTDALAALDARVPLGATDMKKALAAAAESFQGDSKNARTVVYLGDGRSAANLVSAQEFDEAFEEIGFRAYFGFELYRRRSARRANFRLIGRQDGRRAGGRQSRNSTGRRKPDAQIGGRGRDAPSYGRPR